MSNARQIVIVLLLCLFGAGAYALLDSLYFSANGSMPNGEAERRTSDARPVIVTPIRLAENDAVLRAVGSGKALKSVTIYPSAAGEVVEVAFAAGQHVESGETLIRLEDEAERLAVDLAAARAQEAAQMLKRYERARPTGAVSAAQLDTARAALEQARIAREQARVELEDTTVEAPFAGVVGLPLVDPGDRVSETTEITTLDDRSTVLVDFDIPEAYANRVSVGDEVSADAWAAPGEAYSGKIVAVGSRIDPVARTLSLRAALPNPDQRLRTGMSFSVTLRIDGEPFPSVPEIAVQWGREGAFIWVARDGKAERIAVSPRQRRDGLVLFEGPVQAEELVVVEGLQRLRPGIAVDASVVESSAQDAAPFVGEGT